MTVIENFADSTVKPSLTTSPKGHDNSKLSYELPADDQFKSNPTSIAKMEIYDDEEKNKIEFLSSDATKVNDV